MITKASLVYILVFVCILGIFLFVKTRRKKMIALIIAILISLPMIVINRIYDCKYYYDYNKFYNEFETVKHEGVDNFLVEPDIVIESGEKICYYHDEFQQGRSEKISVSFILEDTVYEKWKIEHSREIEDMNLTEGEEIIGLTNSAFKVHGEALVCKVAKEDLQSGAYYVQKFHHSPNIVYGTIMNDDTHEVIHFYFHG